MVFGRILRVAKAHNCFQHLITHSSRIYNQTSASRDLTRLALRRPFASHSVVKSEEGDVAASEADEGGVKKVQKNFLLPSHQHGGLNLTDLKAEIAKVLDSYDNQFNGFLATLTEDQVELIKKSLNVISVMEDGCVELHRM